MNSLYRDTMFAGLAWVGWQQWARKYYEQGVIYFLYGLGPVIFLGCVGVSLTFEGPRLFPHSFETRLPLIGGWLVCGGLLYCLLGALFTYSGWFL